VVSTQCHPLARGFTGVCLELFALSTVSSPCAGVQNARLECIIPVRGGSPDKPLTDALRIECHPHARGFTASIDARRKPASASSPFAGVHLMMTRTTPEAGRVIPVRGGSPSANMAISFFQMYHPRARGCTCRLQRETQAWQMSSPCAGFTAPYVHLQHEAVVSSPYAGVHRVRPQTKPRSVGVIPVRGGSP